MELTKSQGAVPVEDRRYLYDGWLLLMELDGLNNNAVLRRYTWGLDLSGSLHGAGGVGGLLAVHDANGTPADPADDGQYVYFHDANGNVGQLIDATYLAGQPAATFGDIAAHYEYTDPFGTHSVAAGPYAASNPFRFSTKPHDEQAGLYYYGHRYYSPSLGRWLNRDPINELGSMLLREVSGRPTDIIPGDLQEINGYASFRNNPISWFDPNGAESTTQPTSASQNTCVVELRCGGAMGVTDSLAHCEFDIVRSVGGTGTCGCGPGSCTHSSWFTRWCVCRGFCVRCFFVQGAPDAFGTAKQLRILPESACECLRKKCGNYPGTQCYGVDGPNSNTAANCLNNTCALGFSNPGNAPGWDYGKKRTSGNPNWKPCPPGL
jgi:RHS repeat-associated protein